MLRAMGVTRRALWQRSAGLAARAARPYASGPAGDTFLSSTNAAYIDEMYAAWQQDPASVHVSWDAYFRNMKNPSIAAGAAFVAPPTLVPTATDPGVPQHMPSVLGEDSDVLVHLKVQLLCRAYQVRGHQKAHIDPLGIAFGDDKSRSVPRELTLEHYNFSEKDLEREITLGPGILPRFARDGRRTMKLGEIVAALEKLYCSSYGVEYIHIPSREQCEWLRERIEIPKPYDYSAEEKKQIFDRLTWATSFESFLSSKFPNDKRFGLEGLEAVVPGIKTLIDRSVDLGIEDVVLGMAHRGRLNVLSNVVRKPNESIFSEFQGSHTPSDYEGSGDVKYHLGMNYQRPTTSGKYVNLSLVANPSHLEAENPVVLGRVRAIQHSKNDVGTFKKAMGVLLHGDAAFAAQGVVYETMGFLHLPAYSTGGTIHVITNNQIGFTTDPRFARSTSYPSDIGKTIDAPIFHVNANDIEAVNFIFNLAAEWRATFHTDAIIDVVGWRKHGHNETDQPSFTQPLMYKQIAKQPSVIDVYTKKLLDEGSMTNEQIDTHKKWVWGLFEEAFSKAKEYKPSSREWLTAAWENFKSPKELATEILPHNPTNVDASTLKQIGSVLSSWPTDFEVHRNLKRILLNRGKSIESGEGIDWSTGEALAFGTMLMEGTHIRVSGEDVERGTFSQRHAVLHDQNSENTYTPLKHVSKDQADFTICNSSLSEYGCIGFDYGYSLTSPDYFVMWEAQFGDFANTAQVIIDQFIAGAETKWKQRSGLVLSLPHGYDGQGPEHSSGRLERFLQLTNEDPRYFPSEEKIQREHQDCNFQVAYPTTPANLFHILRRQQHRQFRKPLVLFFSKQLLRHPLARSSLSEFTDGGFQWIIEDIEHGKAIVSKEETKRLVILTGQVYTALHKKREALGDRTTAFLRIEQLHPFPYAQLRDALNSYPNLEDIVWCQEEPFNMGSWAYVQPRIQTTLKETDKYSGFAFRYAGRNPSGAVAAGSKALHTTEEEAFLKDVFGQ